MRVGVVGLGSMGGPIARAISAQHEVAVFDVDEARMAAVAEDGRCCAVSVVELVSRSEVLITVLPGPAETASVIFESVSAFEPGTTWLDLSTGDPEVTSRLVSRLALHGVRCVAAPMSGGPLDAEKGTLHFTVAGDPSAVNRIAPLLELLAAPDGVDVIGGEPSHAQIVKLLSNVLWFGHVVATTEAMLLGRALGVDPRRLLELLAQRAGRSALLERDYAHVLDGTYMASFGLDRVVEQLSTASRLAAAHGVPFELTALVERIHRETLEAYGPLQGELLAVRLLEERAGAPLSSFLTP